VYPHPLGTVEKPEVGVHQLADAFFWVNLSYYETTTFLFNKTAKASFRTPKPLSQHSL
jgi:hypothetical protein